jgi:hydroxymethylbilane synthase
MGAPVVAVSMRIGTRRSTMALAHAEDIARRLSAAPPDIDVEIVKFEIVGDTDQGAAGIIARTRPAVEE